MSSQDKVRILFGAAHIDALPDLQGAYDLMSSHNVTSLDTAHLYGKSESVIGSSGASHRFSIDTKSPGWHPGSLTPQNIKDAMAKSLKDLGVNQVDTYYLHAPDTQTPIEESLGAINELYLEGKFKRFGLSNYNATDVQRIHEIATQKGWILPTVFEGNYNPVARHVEVDLFPVLRKLGMTFNAYSPLAGGFLVRFVRPLRPEYLCWKAIPWYVRKPSLIAALDKWGDTATQAGITKAALAYRWVAFHSTLKGEYGDGMVIGASSVKQLRETLEAYEAGPLPETAASQVQEIWEMCKHEAPVDNYTATRGPESEATTYGKS